jgi:D-alanyl-D-alanine carboxypeptidase/D-alanyl-D-alanine-endopeptidase (penicillin-binding protein 4)
MAASITAARLAASDSTTLVADPQGAAAAAYPGVVLDTGSGAPSGPSGLGLNLDADLDLGLDLAEPVPAPPPAQAPPAAAPSPTAPPPAETVPAPAPVAEVLARHAADPRFAGSTLGVSLWIEGIGQIDGPGAHQPLQPASTQKLLTATGVLALLDPAESLTTEVRAAGRVDGGTLDGDLVLVGGGDPSLASRGRHSLDTLAAQVRAAGIATVTGWLVADESRYDNRRGAPGWLSNHVPRQIGPLSALAVDGNQLRADAEYATYPLPASAAAFRAALGRQGVRVMGGDRAGAAPPDAPVVARAHSSPISTLVARMLTDSHNFTAELLVKEVGFRHAGRGTTADGLAAVHRVLSQLGVAGTGRSADGSGLSRADRRPAAELVQLLVAARSQPWFGALLDGLAVSGRTGTLANRFRGTALEGAVRAKTGTIREAQTLAGYTTTKAGRPMAFAVLVNGSAPSPGVRAAIDELVLALATVT